LKKQQAAYDVSRAWDDVKKNRERISEINALFDALEVKAPKPGLVIYSYDRFGNKIEAGSTVSRWSPTIAELPDLSSMISKTYINEIDISKVRIGQKAKIGIDAFPDKYFEGRVVSVANIGQVLPEGDAKVFEVIVKLFNTDSDLRPAMTTSNTITTDSVSDALYVPLEGIFKNDSTQYVYLKKKSNWIRQIVESGNENANYVVIERGLKEGMIIALTQPANYDELPIEGDEIYWEMKKKEAAIKAEQTENQEDQKERSPRSFGERRENNHRPFIKKPR
jgi:hypothetical protein